MRHFSSKRVLGRNRPRRAGFTLVELLAVIAIIGILMVYLLPKIPEVFDRAEVTACKKNMMELYSGIQTYKMDFERLPNESGVAFFTAIVSKGVWENTKTSARKMTCPGVDIGALPGISDIDATEWYTDLDLVDGTYSAYAGRNTLEFPLKKLNGKQILLADDNDGAEGNHMLTTNALYGDGAVNNYVLSTEKENGNVDPDEDYILVGPDSPIADLAKLSLD
jgi:prepilin-type N-terminal cleavage/methylation domain-containing protein